MEEKEWGAPRLLQPEMYSEPLTGRSCSCEECRNLYPPLMVCMFPEASGSTAIDVPWCPWVNQHQDSCLKKEKKIRMYRLLWAHSSSPTRSQPSVCSWITDWHLYSHFSNSCFHNQEDFMCKLRKAFSEGPQKRLFLPEEISEIRVSAVEVETVTFGIPEPGVSNTFHPQGQG